MRTHGLPETNSQPARLILSGPRAVAKALTAADVETFDLSADLVILSACDSGLQSGTLTGLNDLVPAFFAAGARHVIATSWRLTGPIAKEITSRLVSDYFNEDHRDFARSLQAGQLSLANSPAGAPFRHPYFWAGFILLGTP